MYAKFGKYCKIHGVIEFLSPPNIYWISNNITIGSRNTLILSLSANGTSPISYSWKKANQFLTGQNSNFLIIPNISSDAGTYSCILSNIKGVSYSTGIQVTIVESLSIIKQTEILQLNSGSTAIFSVTATGAEPITYKWFKDGIETSGTSFNYYVPNINSSNQGYYQCVITNSISQISSNLIPLSVI